MPFTGQKSIDAEPESLRYQSAAISAQAGDNIGLLSILVILATARQNFCAIVVTLSGI